MDELTEEQRENINNALEKTREHFLSMTDEKMKEELEKLDTAGIILYNNDALAHQEYRICKIAKEILDTRSIK